MAKQVPTHSRDRELIAYFFEGRSLHETGLKFGLTRERVRQILVAHGITVRGLGKKVKPPKPPKPTPEQKFWSKVNKDGPTQPHMDTPCWEWTGGRTATKTKNGEWVPGYGAVYFRKRQDLAHRISWLLANRKTTTAKWVLHKCDNTLCVNPNHLYEGTPKDNSRDRDVRGRGAWQRQDSSWGGQRNAKLTEAQVLEIVALLGTAPQREIGARFKISRSAVSAIAIGAAWSYLTGIAPTAPSIITKNQARTAT